MPVEVVLGGPKDDKNEDLEAQEGLHTLLEAQEIQCNKPLMERIHVLAAKKKAKLTSIQSLKNAYDQKFNKPAEEGEESNEEDLEEPKKEIKKP